MIERIEGIVLETVRHNERHNVVTLYTRKHGRMAFLVPAGRSKTGKMRNTALSLMAVVAFDINIRAGKELHTLRNVEPVRLWHNIYSNPLKSTILFFMAEFCSRLLRQYPADERLWDYIKGSLEILESTDSVNLSNFHIAFILRLLPLAGIEPAPAPFEDGDRFDMLSGEMVGRDNPEFLRRRILLEEEESRKVALILRMNYRNMGLFKMGREQRNHLLERLLEYVSIHLPIGREFKTLPVLREFFA